MNNLATLVISCSDQRTEGSLTHCFMMKAACLVDVLYGMTSTV